MQDELKESLAHQKTLSYERLSLILLKHSSASLWRCCLSEGLPSFPYINREPSASQPPTDWFLAHRGIIMVKLSLKIGKKGEGARFRCTIRRWLHEGIKCGTHLFTAFSCCLSLFITAVENNSWGNHSLLSAALYSSSSHYICQHAKCHRCVYLGIST